MTPAEQRDAEAMRHVDREGTTPSEQRAAADVHLRQPDRLAAALRIAHDGGAAIAVSAAIVGRIPHETRRLAVRWALVVAARTHDAIDFDHADKAQIEQATAPPPEQADVERLGPIQSGFDARGGRDDRPTYRSESGAEEQQARLLDAPRMAPHDPAQADLFGGAP